MIQLEKKFRFESAHRLAKGYSGKCSNIHGHSWNGKIIVTADEEDMDDVGMIVDYGYLKLITKEIENHFDHKIILFMEDPMVMDLEGKTDMVVMDNNPTSEVIAAYIFNEVSERIEEDKKPCKLLAVEIEETCTTRCTFIKD